MLPRITLERDMTELTELSFERAQYDGATTQAVGTPCAQCGSSVGEQYWTLHGQVLCSPCRMQVNQALAAARSGASFGKALWMGGLTALACGIAYAFFVAFTEVQLALITIGIAFAVAKVVRRASRGIGGLRYQILAVCLTYFASAMGYAPALFSAFKHDKAETAQASDAQGSGEEKSIVPPESKPAEQAARTSEASTGKSSGFELFVGVLLILAAILATPVMAIADAPIGFVIVLFGLWEAWKLTRPAQIVIAGPFRTETVPTRVLAHAPAVVESAAS
jgi:hypothetical protein